MPNLFAQRGQGVARTPEEMARISEEQRIETRAQRGKPCLDRAANEWSTLNNF